MATSRRLKLKNPVNTRGILNKIKSALYISINHYWKDLTRSDILIASLLDPRIKDLSFVLPEKYNDTKNLLLEKKFEAMSQDLEKTRAALAEVLASTNLVNWAPLGQITSSNGFLNFTDGTATNFPVRFYKVMGGQ